MSSRKLQLTSTEACGNLVANRLGSRIYLVGRSDRSTFTERGNRYLSRYDQINNDSTPSNHVAGTMESGGVLIQLLYGLNQAQSSSLRLNTLRIQA
jgi:hypothetical protein